MTNLKKNLVYNVVYQILLLILPLILTPYASRVLGADGIGAFSYTGSIAGTTALLGMLGVNNYGNRSISVVRDDREKRSTVFWNIWFWQAVLTFLASAGYILYLLFLCRPEFKVISCIELLTVLNSMADINWLFFGLEEFKLTVVRNVVIKVLSVLTVFLFVKSEQDLWIYVLIMAGSVLLSNLVLWTFVPGYIDFKMPEWKKAADHLAKLLLLFVPVIAISVYQKMDKIMLGSFSIMEQSGYYENVEKIINIPKGVITALGTVMLPRMSYLMARKETETIQTYIFHSMEFVMFSSSAMAFGIAAVAGDFAPFFFGNEFSSIGPLIQLMSISIIVVACANVIRTQYLIPGSKDKIYLGSVWAGAAVNFAVNLWLIPKYGALGAVTGTVAAECCVMMYQMFYVWGELDFAGYLKRGIYYIFCGGGMYLGVKGTAYALRPHLKLSSLVFCEVLTGAGIYILLSAPYLLAVHKDEFIDYFKTHKKV